MPRIPGTVIDSLTRSLITVDGCHVVLQARTADGDEINIGIPQGQISEFVDHLAFGAARTEEIVRNGRKLGAAVTWWNSAVDQDSGNFSLTLTFGQGGALCFEFTDHMAKALLTSLRNHFEPNTAAPLQLNQTTASELSVLTEIVAAEQIMPGFVDGD